MGTYINPNNSAFQVALNSEIYIDKTELLSYTNKVLGSKEGLVCNSRPRRFGKSITADMLVAYYSKGCQSDGLLKNTWALNGILDSDTRVKKHWAGNCHKHAAACPASLW